MSVKYSAKDFEILSWIEYQAFVERIGDDIKKYCDKHRLNIECIVPILRGGGPLSISLSHLLNIAEFFPCQFKYEYVDEDSGRYEPIEYLSTIEFITDKNKDITILVTEGNHVRGETAKKCIHKIKSILPNAKIIYVSVGRDYAHKGRLTDTVFETWGFLTNETKTLNKNDCEMFKVKDKFVVYPWEVIEEEIIEVNNSIDCNNGEIDND